jgi:hypothetical protein
MGETLLLSEKSSVSKVDETEDNVQQILYLSLKEPNYPGGER